MLIQWGCEFHKLSNFSRIVSKGKLFATELSNNNIYVDFPSDEKAYQNHVRRAILW